MSPISEKLQALSAVSAKLNNATDELNSVIERIEDDVQRSGVGVTVWLGCPSGHPRMIAPSDWRRPHQSDGACDNVKELIDFWAIGFTKFGDTWRIAARRMQQMSGDDDLDYAVESADPVPLVSAPRQVRLEAAEHLESLVEQLTGRAQSMLKNIETAKSLVQE